jgi:hypothetical protein
MVSQSRSRIVNILVNKPKFQINIQKILLIQHESSWFYRGVACSMTNPTEVEWWKIYVGPTMAANYTDEKLLVFIAQATFHGVQLGLDKKMEDRTFYDVRDFQPFLHFYEDEAALINIIRNKLIDLSEVEACYVIREAAWCFYIVKNGYEKYQMEKKKSQVLDSLREIMGDEIFDRYAVQLYALLYTDSCRRGGYGGWLMYQVRPVLTWLKEKDNAIRVDKWATGIAVTGSIHAARWYQFCEMFVDVAKEQISRIQEMATRTNSSMNLYFLWRYKSQLAPCFC